MNRGMEIEWLKDFGARLREARVRKEMTQETLAAKLGVSGQTISTYERGTQPIPPARAVALATLLQVDIETVTPPPSADRDAAFSYAVAGIGVDRALIAVLRQALPKSVIETMEEERWRSGLTVQRMLTALTLSHQMQSLHIRSMCVSLATAIDEGQFTLDEAICFFRVQQPAVMEPRAPDFSGDRVKDYLSERLAVVLIDLWEGQAKNQSGGKRKSWVEAMDADEREYAKERTEEAEQRRQAGKEAAPERKESKK